MRKDENVAIQYARFKGLDHMTIKAVGGIQNRWSYPFEGKQGRVPRFSMGVSSLSRGANSTILGLQDEEDREKICMVTKGKMRVRFNGEDRILERLDCLYVPPGIDYRIINPASSSLWYIWLVAPHLSSNELSGFRKNTHVNVIRGLGELEPLGLELGKERVFYPIITAKGFNFEMFVRLPKTHSRLHTHDPMNCEEAFVVIAGLLRITDTTGKSFTLRQYDFVYVPPFGGNMNENIGTKNVWYLCVEAPAGLNREVVV